MHARSTHDAPLLAVAHVGDEIVGANDDVPGLPARVERRLERLGRLGLVPLLVALGRPQPLELLVDAPGVTRVESEVIRMGGRAYVRSSDHLIEHAPGEAALLPQHQPPHRARRRSCCCRCHPPLPVVERCGDAYGCVGSTGWMGEGGRGNRGLRQQQQAVVGQLC